MADDVVVTEPWVDLRGGGEDERAQRDRFLAEICAEVSAGHPLFEVQFDVVGRSLAKDDVLVRLSDARWAIVHVTWTRPERSPWPTTQFFESAADVERAIDLLA